MSHFDQVRELFLKARQLPAGQHAAFLDSVCAEDAALRKELEGLLAADAAGDDLLSATRPAVCMPAHIGPYQVLEVLGEGGMGTVYKAQQHTPISRTVAIKVIIPGCSTRELLARFEAERRALARMSHPNIATVLDAGTTETDLPYFAMEFVPGRPITTFADLHSLTIRQRLILFAQVCDAVAHAHSKGIIHRDIKASNVLAYMQDGKPFAKIIDFGIAKAMEADRFTSQTLATVRGRAMGTYEYMSPEQARGAADIDTLTDVYSLGVLLYELLTGEAPFDAHTLREAADEEIRRIISEVEPPRPSTRLSSLGQKATDIALARQVRLDSLTRELRSELEWIPLMAMRKERQRRYNSPLQLAQDITNYLESRPLIAGPESRVYRARKFVYRRRVPILAGAVAMMGIAVGAIGLMMGLREHAPASPPAVVAAPAIAASTLPTTAAQPGPVVNVAPVTPADPPPETQPELSPVDRIAEENANLPPGMSRVHLTLLNADMSIPWEGTQGVAGWGATRDTSVFRSAPASLRITNTVTEGGPGAVTERVRTEPGRTYALHGWYRTQGSAVGSPAIFCWGEVRDAKTAPAWWEPAAQTMLLDDAPQWKQFHVFWQALPGTHSVGLHLRAKGEGTVWYDDLTLEALERKGIIYNGDMALGDDVPDGWATYATKRSDPGYSRDTAVFRSAPASLCVGTGRAAQDMLVTPGRRYRFSAYIRDPGLQPAGVTVPWGEIWFIHRKVGGEVTEQIRPARIRAASGWTLHQVDFVSPDDSRYLELVLIAHGGPVWFDDISIDELPGATAKPAPAATPAPPPATPAASAEPAPGPKILDVLPNGDMTQADPTANRPVDWWDGTRDTRVFHSAPASLRLTFLDAAAFHVPAVSAFVRAPPLHRYQVTGWYRTEGDAEPDVSLWWYDQRGAQVGSALSRLPKSPEWRELNVVHISPRQAESARVLVSARGAGSVWFDDFALKEIGPPPLVYNGDMTAGADMADGWIPAQWLYFDSPSQREAYARDTDVFRSTPASLRLGKPDSGQGVSQLLPLIRGIRYRISGYMKYAPPSEPGWMEIVLRSTDGPPIYARLQPVKMETGWAFYECEVTPPPDTDTTALVLAAEKGYVWFDDIEIEAIPAPTAP